ncbi:AzlD domain-containing protein [Desulfovibrio litoralis]|uniref:Branched-chain amino acid transport protein n=1 Tax=Desulfovibrio litoralis DSM 11393 TaxID=1121455 RepID=A0A1M7RTP1_9BACT|nr:AzlD domain-containing protein [Desulfovibrio litoralis]SHN49707.1 Branched-chain amino acid transport protein [Desulfovibrio litoralis DSM 11393]
MFSLDHAILILGMAAVTYFSRATPLLLLSGKRLNPFIERWLKCVPAAVLTAMLVPDLIMNKADTSTLFLSFQNPFILAAIPSFLIARFRGGFFAPVLTGVGTLAFLRYLSTNSALFKGLF